MFQLFKSEILFAVFFHKKTFLQSQLKKTSYDSKFLRHLEPKIWNILEKHIRSVYSLSQFINKNKSKIPDGFPFVSCCT